MVILRSSSDARRQSRRSKSSITRTALWMVPPMLATGSAWADPQLPEIGNGTTYNVTVSNASIDGGAVVTSAKTGAQNEAVIQAFINFVTNQTAANTGATNGFAGATIIVPAGTYNTTTLTLKSNVDLEVDGTLQNSAPTNTMITTTGTLNDIAITGTGILQNNATTTSGNNMLSLQKITDLLVQGVSIENAAHEHLVPEGDTNVTINSITITDSASRANTDGIDYSGTNFLIENSTISDGDDDIVAKPQSTFTGNVTIINDTILIGHGISIGGQTGQGMNNMTVNNITFNGTDNGLRLKAGRDPSNGSNNGGLVTNVSYSNITMTNVPNPIQISSWYNGGGDNYPNGGTNTTSSTHGSLPNTATNMTYKLEGTPAWQNIAFTNITSLNSTGTGSIYGLPEAPVENVSFTNVSLSGTSPFVINFAGYSGAFNPVPNANEVYMQNVILDGNLLTQASLLDPTLFTQPNNGLFDAEVVIASVPEPASAGLMVLSGSALLARRRRKTT